VAAVFFDFQSLLTMESLKELSLTEGHYYLVGVDWYQITQASHLRENEARSDGENPPWVWELPHLESLTLTGLPAMMFSLDWLFALPSLKRVHLESLKKSHLRNIDFEDSDEEYGSDESDTSEVSLDSYRSYDSFNSLNSSSSLYSFDSFTSSEYLRRKKKSKSKMKYLKITIGKSSFLKDHLDYLYGRTGLPDDGPEEIKKEDKDDNVDDYDVENSENGFKQDKTINIKNKKKGKEKAKDEQDDQDQNSKEDGRKSVEDKGFHYHHNLIEIDFGRNIYLDREDFEELLKKTPMLRTICSSIEDYSLLKLIQDIDDYSHECTVKMKGALRKQGKNRTSPPSKKIDCPTPPFHFLSYVSIPHFRKDLDSEFMDQSFDWITYAEHMECKYRGLRSYMINGEYYCSKEIYRILNPH
jgi:hypothetical protein